MTEQVRRYLAPFQALHVVFDAPKRPNFAIRRFKGILGAFRLLWRARKTPRLIKAEEAFNDAIKAHSIGRFNEAEELYTKCTTLHPDHEPAYTNLAALYLERNSEDLAIEELKKGLRVRPYYYRGYYNLGLIYRQIGNIEQAIVNLEQALRYNEKHFYSMVVLAEILASRQDLEGAIELYGKALPLCSSPASLHMRLAELFLKRRELDQCERSLLKAIDIKETPELQYNLGWLMAFRGEDPEKLVDCFLKARKYKPDFKEALLNLALSQAAAGYHELSVENMLKYVHDFTKNTKEEQLKHLDYLRQINPGNHHAAMKVAQLHMDSGQVQKAIEVLSEVLKTAVQHSPAIEMLAEIYRRMGRHKEAIKTYRRLIEIAPRSVSGYLGLSRAYGDIENFAAAMPVLKKVLELDAHNADIHYQYATLLAQQGNMTLALTHYKRVASLDSNYPRIKKRLRMLEEELEEMDESAPSHPWPTASRKHVVNSITNQPKT